MGPQTIHGGRSVVLDRCEPCPVVAEVLALEHPCQVGGDILAKGEVGQVRVELSQQFTIH